MITMLHPEKVPIQLTAKYLEYGCNVRKLEEVLHVNRYYIYQLLRYGKEPTSRTRKGMKARVSLFLEKGGKREYPDYIREWMKLSKEERHKVIKTYIDWKKEHINE